MIYVKYHKNWQKIKVYCVEPITPYNRLSTPNGNTIDNAGPFWISVWSFLGRLYFFLYYYNITVVKFRQYKISRVMEQYLGAFVQTACRVHRLKFRYLYMLLNDIRPLLGGRRIFFYYYWSMELYYTAQRQNTKNNIIEYWKKKIILFSILYDFCVTTLY